jgi:hypothetical protein
MSHRFLLSLVVALVAMVWPADATAEIVFLTSGRTILVKSYKINGESITLTLRTGGEVTCDRSIIEKILPDEAPYPEPAAAAQRSAKRSSRSGRRDPCSTARPTARSSGPCRRPTGSIRCSFGR